MSDTYQVVDTETKEVVNFYSVKLPQALLFAKDCRRKMKSISGKTYDLIVRLKNGEQKSLKDYENTLGGKSDS